MADGATFDIDIEAKNLGVDASAEQLNALVGKIQQTNTVATQFDKVIAAARSRLEEASAAAKLASEALAGGEARYKELESAANKAAKEVEKAAAAGKDTSALQLAASAAAAKMRDEAAAVDSLRLKSADAAAVQKKLADSLKTLEGQAANAAAEIKKAKQPVDNFSEATKILGADSRIEKIKKIAKAFDSLHTAAAMTALGVVVMSAAAIAGVGALAAFAVASNPVAMMKLSLASERFSRGVKQLFTGVKLDKFVHSVEDLGTLFDKGTSSANGMKLLVETLLQPLFDGAAKVEPLVKEAFKGMVYGALQIAIAVLKARNAIFNMMPPETRAAIKKFTDSTFTLENAFNVGAIAAIALAAVFVVLIVSLAALAVAEIVALWPIFLIIAVVALVIAAFMYWDEIIATLSDTLDEWVTGAKDAVNDVIDGIVNGIKDGAGAVWDAMKNMAKGAVTAFKGALGIKSPSTVMKLQAHYTAAGYIEGIDDAAPSVNSALESMVSPASAAGGGSGAGGAGASSGGSKSSKSLHIEQLNIHAAGGDGESIAAAVKRALLEVMEGASLTIGGGEAPAS